MKALRLFCLLLVIVAQATAQVTPRDILSRFSSSDIRQSLIKQNDWHPFPQTPEAWRKQVPDSIINGIISQATAIKDKPFTNIPATVILEYKQTGNRAHYESLSFDKRNRLFTLALAESMENKGRFTDAIANGVWNICEETYWGASAHIGTQHKGVGLPDVADPTVDLFGAETAAVLAMTDYFTGAKLDKISPLLRQRIYWEVNHKILNSFENETARYFFYGNGKRNVRVNNWNPWVTSNCMMSFLLLEKNEDRRVKLVQLSMSLLDLYINGLGEDGATDEGPSYWFAAGMALFDGLNILSDATQHHIQVFNNPIIQKLGSYIYKTHIDGDYFVNVADANPRIHADGIAIYRFGKAVQDPKMMAFGAWAFHNIENNKPSIESFFRPRQVWDMLAETECSRASQDDVLLPGMYLPSVELMTARSKNDLFLAAHGGNNGESHNHNDVGDFTVYSKGDPVIIDVGRGTYMAITFSKDRYKLWYNTSPYHNLPTINGAQQEAEASARATNVHYSQEKDLTDFSMNIESAYPVTSNLVSWHRDIRMHADANLIEVTDTYVSKTPQPDISQSFMTVCAVDITEPGKLVFTTEHQHKVVLTYDVMQWKVIKEVMPLTEPHEQGVKSNWDHQPVTRIRLIAKQAAQSGRFRYSIQQ